MIGNFLRQFAKPGFKNEYTRSRCFSSAAPLTLEQNFNELETRGFTVVDNIFNPTEIESLKEDYKVIKSKAYNMIEESEEKTRYFEESGIPTTSKYWKKGSDLIMQAGEGRYDFARGFDEGIFGSDSVVKNPKLMEMMTNTLKNGFTSYGGVVQSEAGSKNQYWHRDVDTLSNEGTNGEALVTIDDFYFTVLVPITVPITQDNGPTEFMSGSHRHPATEYDKCPPKISPPVPLGSALVFNGKMNHRGTGNPSSEDRPVIYRVFHKRWYNDFYRVGIDDVEE